MGGPHWKSRLSRLSAMIALGLVAAAVQAGEESWEALNARSNDLRATRMLYDDYIFRLADRFDSAFKEIEAEINFELGDEFEIALCNVIRSSPPSTLRRKTGVAGFE